MKVLIVKRKKRATWTSWKGKWRCKAISLPLEEAGKAWVLLASLTVWKDHFNCTSSLSLCHLDILKLPDPDNKASWNCWSPSRRPHSQWLPPPPPPLPPLPPLWPSLTRSKLLAVDQLITGPAAQISAMRWWRTDRDYHHCCCQYWSRKYNDDKSQGHRGALKMPQLELTFIQS